MVSLALLSAVTADTTGTGVDVSGYNGAQYVEIQKTNTGTCNVLIEGSFDKSVWYQVGYYTVDGNDTLTRGHGNISVAATNPWDHIYQALDGYRWLRASTNTSAGTYSLTATVHCTPV